MDETSRIVSQLYSTVGPRSAMSCLAERYKLFYSAGKDCRNTTIGIALDGDWAQRSPVESAEKWSKAPSCIFCRRMPRGVHGLLLIARIKVDKYKLQGIVEAAGDSVYSAALQRRALIIPAASRSALDDGLTKSLPKRDKPLLPCASATSLPSWSSWAYTLCVL